MCIAISKDYCKWSSCRVSFKNSAQDFRGIRLDAGSSAYCTALSSEDVLSEIICRQWNPCRNTIKDHTQSGTVGFTE